MLAGALDLAGHIMCSHHDDDGHVPDVSCECMLSGSCTFAAKTVVEHSVNPLPTLNFGETKSLPLIDAVPVFPGHGTSVDHPPRA